MVAVLQCFQQHYGRNGLVPITDFLLVFPTSDQLEIQLISKI